MKKYDVFKSQNGYAVALGVYNDSPVMGQCILFETKEKAEEYSKNRKTYDKAYSEWEEKMAESGGSENLRPPLKWEYDLRGGIKF